MKKRILIVTNRFYPQIGGAEINIFFQSEELGKHFLVDVVAPIRDKNKKKEIVNNIRIFRLYNFYNLFNKFPYLSSKTLCPGIFFKILFGKYDIVHCFPAYSYNNIAAIFAAKIKRVPLFLSNFDLFDYSDLMNNKKMSLRQILRLRLNKKQKWFLSKCKAIFVISEKEANLIKRVNKNTFLSIVPVKLEEYDKPLDLIKFKSRFHIKKGAKVILCLSRISFIKGQDILLKALPLLKKKFDDFIVLIVGRTDCEPKYFQKLKTFVKENNLEKQVFFTGALSRDNVLAALKACDVHVLPMRFMNSGAVVIETWASKKPILQSKKIDPNYVIEGKNGFTFDIDNPQELAEKMKYFLINPTLCKEMGLNGRKLVEEKFLYSYLVKQYISQYKLALSG